MLSTIVQNERITNVLCIVVLFIAFYFILYLREREIRKNDLNKHKSSRKYRNERKGEWRD